MDMVIGYGGVILFTALVIYVMQRGHRPDGNMSEYATGGRNFSSWFGTMSFLNTWIAGTVFISFAGMAAGGGMIGFYSLSYGLLAVVLMFFLGKPVNQWGRVHDLRTQANLLGLRYNSTAVRVVAGIIGVIASIPWVVLGMQALGLVFSTLSFGRIEPVFGLIIGVVFIAARQIWTVRYGTRGLIVSDMVQGIMAYGIGFLIILGLLIYLVTGGHGLGEIAPGMLALPGLDSPVGPLYLFSLVFTGLMGAWSWPDIFVRLLSVRSPRSVQKSAVQAATILFLFCGALFTLCLLASSYPGVADAPDLVWFTITGVGGVGLVTAAGICVVAATMGNVGANLQATGTQFVNDVISPNRRVESSKGAKIAIAAITIISAVAALFTANVTSGILILALISYQAICQLAPTILLGIFWRRANAAGATAGMIAGIVIAAVLEIAYPVSIPWLGGLTSGVAGIIVNTALIVAFAYLKPADAVERKRVDGLFDSLKSQSMGPSTRTLSAAETEVSA